MRTSLMLVFQASPNIVIALAGNKADLTTNRIGEPRSFLNFLKTFSNFLQTFTLSFADLDTMRNEHACHIPDEVKTRPYFTYFDSLLPTWHFAVIGFLQLNMTKHLLMQRRTVFSSWRPVQRQR